MRSLHRSVSIALLVMSMYVQKVCRDPQDTPAPTLHLGLYQVDAVTPRDVTAWATLKYPLATAWASPHLERRCHFGVKQSLNYLCKFA